MRSSLRILDFTRVVLTMLSLSFFRNGEEGEVPDFVVRWKRRKGSRRQRRSLAFGNARMKVRSFSSSQAITF